MEAERGHDRGLVGGVVAFDVAGRVGLGVALGLRVLERHVEIEALRGHLVEDVVRSAVDDAEHVFDLVADERFAQGAHNRDRAAHGRFEVDVDVVVFGRLVQFRAVLGEQRLVGGHDGRAVLHRLKHERAGHTRAADQLDDDVRVLDDGHRVGSQQRLLDPRKIDFLRVEARHSGQFDRAPDALRELVLLLHEQTCGLRADGPCPQQAHSNRCVVLCHCPFLSCGG